MRMPHESCIFDFQVALLRKWSFSIHKLKLTHRDNPVLRKHRHGTCDGVLKEILTDQRTNFTSKLLAELYRLLHVKAVRTSPYHLQTDGLVERFNRT